MAGPDLNLLHTLDVLLSENSVTKAGRRLQLSPSAMSRALARLRAVTGDPLLVRAGRSLVPTPRAIEMRDKVRLLVEDAHALLRLANQLDLPNLKRSFTIRASDGIAETFGPSIIGRITQEAPGVELRFVRKLDKSSSGLRDGSVDLETGVVDQTIGPEVRSQALFTDRYVGLVRIDHAVTRRTVTSTDFVSWSHVVTRREGLGLGGINDVLRDQGLVRRIAVTVDGFSAALALARHSDLIATVPERHTAGLCDGMHLFAIPLPLREFTISLMWHPRLNGDPAHQWLRAIVRDACHSSKQNMELARSGIALAF